MGGVISKIRINDIDYDLAFPTIETELTDTPGRNGQIVIKDGNLYYYNDQNAQDKNHYWHPLNIDWYMDPNSSNAVQNKVIYNYVNNLCSHFITTYTADQSYMKKVQVVKEAPTKPDADRIYFITD